MPFWGNHFPKKGRGLLRVIHGIAHAQTGLDLDIGAVFNAGDHIHLAGGQTTGQSLFVTEKTSVIFEYFSNKKSGEVTRRFLFNVWQAAARRRC